jgi:hypothetical protein
MNKKININNCVVKLEVGDIIYSPTTSLKVNSLIVTYIDENIIGASTILTKSKKTNWRQNNIVILKESEESVYLFKTYVMNHCDLKKHNWVVLNKQLENVMIIEPQPVKRKKVVFDYSNSNSKLKFEVEQSTLQQNLKHKLEGVVEHKDIKLFTYVKLKNN